MISLDNVTGAKIRQNNPKWPQIYNYPYRISITGGSPLGKANGLLNSKSFQQHTDKIYLYAKGPYDVKYQLFTDKWKSIGLKDCDDPKDFIEYLNYMDDIYKNLDEYNPSTNVKYWYECKILIL